MVCGIIAVVFGTVLGFFFITLPLAFILGIVAVVLGIMGVRRAPAAAGTGRGQAISGIVTGGIALVATLFWGFAFGALFTGLEGVFDDPDAFLEEFEEEFDDVEDLEDLEDDT